MLLYNVTIGIDKDVEEEWLHWMKTRHIPDVMNTGMFLDSKIYKVLHDHEEETTSYSVQYFVETIQHMQQYLALHAPALMAEHRERFANKHVAFQTLLEEV
ncbi:MAG: DUF4286 family protein [Cyclobacteriaceae bacterium]|nr:DUF4286 family protein [Cyclobacteriaceae bacterium]